MESENRKVPDILTLVNKEKFRRKLAIASRILAIFLILAIVFIAFVQIKYVKEINEYRSKYGSKWSCYVCGLETGRSCSCNYLPQIAVSNPSLFDRDAWFDNIATENIIPCENRNKKGLDINFSLE